MSDSFETRFQRIARHVLDTRIQLLAIMMNEGGVDADSAAGKLTDLVHALRNPRIESTIFDNGRRMPMAVEDRRIVLNRELLERVGDAEVMNALARPVAQMTGLAPVGVSLAFQLEDEQALRDLATKNLRRAEGDVVRPGAIPEWVQSRIEELTTRLGRTCAHLGRVSAFAPTNSDDLQATIAESPVWPEWAIVSSSNWCESAVASVDEALEDTAFQQHSETLVELLWDSLVLSPQSFIRHAGRTLRGIGGSLDIGVVLLALARGVTGDGSFSTDVADWPAYQDVSEAWRDLNRHECAMFGPVFLDEDTPAASVVHPARLSFGLEEPKELPWDAPLVCWTAREQRALRDLLGGFIKTLPRYTDDALEIRRNIALGDEQPLDHRGERKMLGLQVVALGSEALTPAGSPERAWAASVAKILDQFERASNQVRRDALESLRAAYDDLFPDSRPIWARRLFNMHAASDLERFERLVTTINGVFHVPALMDPFIEPGSSELAPMVTLVLPVGITAPGKVAFFVPMVALTSTLHGAPLRVRVVQVPPQSDAVCGWLCDRGLHLSKLAQQTVELIARSVRGDALQMAIFEA